MSGLKQIPLICSGHTRPVVFVSFSHITPKGYFSISASKDGNPMLREGDKGHWIGTFMGHKGAVWGVALTPDATRAASGSADFDAKLWDSTTGDELHNFTHQHIVKSVDFNPNGQELLTASSEKLLRIFDLNNYSSAATVFPGHTSGVRQCQFLPNGRQFVSASDDKTVRLWDKTSGQEINKLTFDKVPSSLEVSRDGTTLVITYGDVVSFWEPLELKKLCEYKCPSPVNSASLHPDKSVFVWGGEDFKVYKYDYVTGSEIDSFKGHFGPIHCIRFSPDGELYASGSEDGTLRLWQTTLGKNYGLWKCKMPGDGVDGEIIVDGSPNNAGSGDGNVIDAES